MDTLTKISPISAALRPRRELRFNQSMLVEDVLYLRGFTGFQETRAHYETDSQGYFVGLDYLSVAIPDFGVQMKLKQADIRQDVWWRIEDLCKDECNGY
jgi:hypothetical protein